eukprot:jgi/Chlat1/7798/Chrsp66S07258
MRPGGKSSLVLLLVIVVAAALLLLRLQLPGGPQADPVSASTSASVSTDSTNGVRTREQKLLESRSAAADRRRLSQAQQVEGPPKLYTYDVVAQYEHDPTAFTQGLAWAGNGLLYESTGLRGRSSVREVELASGRVLKQTKVPSQYFAEGLTLWRDRLLQLTWLTGTGFVYETSTLKKTFTFQTPYNDGWGLTHNGSLLILTDSGSTLNFIDPNTFKEVRQVQVHDDGRAVTWLNELEFVNGEVWANVWQHDCIARVSPDTGRVVGWILLHGLQEAMQRERGARNADVLNGIAWDPDNDRLFVTGKLWPLLYEIKLRQIEWPPELDLANARNLCIP